MKCTVLLIALALSANAQSPTAQPSKQEETTSAKKVDAKLHAEAIKLVEGSGAKKRLQDSLENIVDESQKAMMDKFRDALQSSGKSGKDDSSNGPTSTTISMSTFGLTKNIYRCRNK